jgi:hypothetical protein
MAAEPDQGEVILFEHTNFHGAHKHIFREVRNLHKADGETAATIFADKTSSIVVVRGTWQFFQDQEFLGHMKELGPGNYRDVLKEQIKPEGISSLRPKPSSSAPPPGSPPPGSPPPS